MIYAHVVSDTRLIAKLKGLGGETRKEIVKSLWRVTLRLQREVKEGKLSGQVLHVRTGTLRRSIHAVVEDKGHAVYGKVGTNVVYGKIHEFGFSGPMQVKEHLRLIKQAWGRPLKTPVQAMVKGHTRNVNLPERSFLRSALMEMGPEIRAELEGAIAKAVRAVQ